MSWSSQSRPLYCFSIFEVDPRSGELRRNGVRLKVQDQPFHILVKLLEHAGELVTREELRSTLWPADTFVDFDNGLNMAMNRLREVLGDVPERPTFIETVPRHGYRFIAPVEKPSSPAPSERAGVSKRRLERLTATARWIAVGATLLLTSSPDQGYDYGPTFSPDAEWLSSGPVLRVWRKTCLWCRSQVASPSG